uniref:Uncharacterized protein n=1 Tax=Ananas comosus var. bracteatus TaxID=296719 RepID=A0A6V7QSV7_ANACO
MALWALLFPSSNTHSHMHGLWTLLGGNEEEAHGIGHGGKREERLINAVLQIAKALGRTDTMTEDIIKQFSDFDGRLSLDKLAVRRDPGGGGGGGGGAAGR